MDRDTITLRAAGYLQQLCVEIPNRRVGSRGNRQATDLFAEAVARFGFLTESPAFDCIDWECDGAQLSVGGAQIPVLVSPYSLGCRVERAPLVSITTVEELATTPIAGAVVLLHGPIAAEPLMPKDFPFYNPEQHQQIIRLLEAGRPQAIIAATGRNPELAGGAYPFPLIEDGDVAIPAVYLTDVAGEALAAQVGAPVTLAIAARRIPARAWNVIARSGLDRPTRIVIFAHIDAKDGTPGALDNAAGVVVLLLLAELCAASGGAHGLELVALNGEDYYSAPGERAYLRANAGRFAEIVLGINIDGVGYRNGPSSYSLYGCPEPIAVSIRQAFAAYPAIGEGAPWYQGDHGLFLMHERPALALTSEDLLASTNVITHTAQDGPELVDCGRLAEVALALRDLIARLG